MSNDVFRSTDGGATWSCVTSSTSWAADLIESSSLVTPDDKIIMTGGIGDQSRIYSNDSWWSVDNGLSWEVAHTIPEYTKLTIDDMQIPSGWDLIDMVLATNYTSGSVGNIYIYITNGEMNNTVSSAIKMYTLPALPPYNTGTWSDVTPSQLTTPIMYLSQEQSQLTHTGLATVVKNSGRDDVYAKYWKKYKLIWGKRYALSSIKLSDGSISVIGGYTNTGDAQNDCWRSIDKGNTWITQGETRSHDLFKWRS